MECHGQAPGFFGKLPSHGDFVGRRLPPEVRQCLDDWLQRALVHSKAVLGPAWLATWGSSPIWRFVIGAGVCGEQAWAGVMMPSADRVGRCFPLLLLAAIDGTPALRACLTQHDGWFAALEEVALSALNRDFSLERFDTGLSALNAAPPEGAVGGCMAMSSTGSGQAQVCPLAPWTRAVPPLAGLSLDGCSAWWSNGSPDVAATLAVCDGLLRPVEFVALLNGRWSEHGWTFR